MKLHNKITSSAKIKFLKKLEGNDQSQTTQVIQFNNVQHMHIHTMSKATCEKLVELFVLQSPAGLYGHPNITAKHITSS